MREHSRILNVSGHVLMGAFALFMAAASIAPKLLLAEVATESLFGVGWPAGHVRVLGFLELACLLIYLAPKTRILGAILLTGLFGGAVAAQFRVGAPIFSHALFGLYLGVAAWAAIWLTNPALRTLLPFALSDSTNRRPGSSSASQGENHVVPGVSR